MEVLVAWRYHYTLINGLLRKPKDHYTKEHEISGYGYSVVSPCYPTVYKKYRGKMQGRSC